jgi:hypothetical protein
VCATCARSVHQDRENWPGVHFHIPARHEAQFGIYARAAWSPPLQAFNRLVISAEDPRMDNPFSAGAQKIYQNVAAVAVRFRLNQRKENKLSR